MAEPTPFTEAETHIATLLGLPAEKIAAWRTEHLTLGLDFQRQRGKPILWTKNAAGRLWAWAGLRPERYETRQLPFAARQILVVHGPTRNSRVLLAHLQGHRPASIFPPHMHRVWVKNAAKYRRGQHIPCRFVADHQWEIDLG